MQKLIDSYTCWASLSSCI